MIALKVESWIWWAVVVTVALMRLASRFITLGSLKKFQADDWILLLVLSTYTTLLVTINIVAETSSNLLPPGFDVNTLTPQDISEREYGSKLILVVEQCQCVTIWSVKAMLLTMYSRFTVGRRRDIFLKALMVYVGFGFVLMEILYFGVWCRPFSNYWVVPTPNVQCDAATNHLITNATFNMSSDLIMMIIALPLFLKLSLPWRKKVIIVCIFSLGLFVVLAAVLNKYYSFTQPFGSEWTFWYVRESSTAILVANLPLLWPLMRRVFGFKSLDGEPRRNSAGGRGGIFTSKRKTSHIVNQGIDPISGRKLSERSSSEARPDSAVYFRRNDILGRHDVELQAALRDDEENNFASTNYDFENKAQSRQGTQARQATTILGWPGADYEYSVHCEGPASLSPQEKVLLSEAKGSQELVRRNSSPQMLRGRESFDIKKSTSIVSHGGGSDHRPHSAASWA